MGVDKGHCTEGIGTGSLSNSPLEKEQQVKRGIQRSREGGVERGEGEQPAGHQTGRVSTLPSSCSSSSTPSSSQCPLITVQDTGWVQSALIKQQQIAGTRET